MPMGVWPTQTVEDNTFCLSLATLACMGICCHSAFSYVCRFCTRGLKAKLFAQSLVFSLQHAKHKRIELLCLDFDNAHTSALILFSLLCLGPFCHCVSPWPHQKAGCLARAFSPRRGSTGLNMTGPLSRHDWETIHKYLSTLGEAVWSHCSCVLPVEK